MPDKIHLTVAALVLHNQWFLMVSEKDRGKIVLNQPAGHVEPGEDILAAAVRETLEETRWQVLLTGLVGVYSHKSVHNGITYYRMCFAATALHQDSTQALDSDIEEVHWMTAEQIRESQHNHRSPSVLACLEDYLKGEVFPLEIFRNRL